MSQNSQSNLLKEVLSIEELTIDQIRKEGRGYNPAEWDKIINRFSSYNNVKFYVARAQRGYSYDRFYATYTIPEGINIMNEVSYSSCIHNGGFCLVYIIAGILYTKLLSDTNGNLGYCENTKENRKVMAKNSQVHGVIYSSAF